MHKFEDANTTWGNVGAYHLDELYSSNRSAFTRLMRCCLSIKQSTTLTLFLFLSPQFFVNHCNALDVFATCAQERTFCLIAMDKAHVHIQHMTSFRNYICVLSVEFFRRIFESIIQSMTALDCSIGNLSHVLPLAFIQLIDCQFHHQELRPQGIGAGFLPAQDQDEV